MNFASDNWSGVHPAISDSLARHAGGYAAAYGTSAADQAVEAAFEEIFERKVAVFFVGTGTAANALAFASVNRPGGIVLCHRGAHVIGSECGAPEFFTQGARMAPVDGEAGRIDPHKLERELSRFKPGDVARGQPMAVSITQVTEAGTLYSSEQIERISGIAKTRGLPLHMDGARFANALAATGLSPAEMTWRRGVDILSFGATKNGCWCAEAVIFFDPNQAAQFPFIRKRAAQLFSKTRFVAAQLEAYLKDGLWLEMAAHANAMAERLRDGLRASDDARLAWPTDANETFAILPKSKLPSLRDAGALFYEWGMPSGGPDLTGDDETLIRLVTSWSTQEDEIQSFVSHLA